jgi:Cu(I)/Ag(I) efflux system membrane protein CusA/SilA
VQRVIMTAVGGENVTTTIEGRERYSVNIRYPRELRDDIGRLGRVLVAVPGAPGMAAQQVPLAQLADITLVSGPAMIRNENGFLSGYVYIDLAGRDIGGFVARPEGGRRPADFAAVAVERSGQRASGSRVVVPITLVLIFAALPNTRSLQARGHAGGTFLSVGAIWLFTSWTTTIRLRPGSASRFGLDAETGFMLLFLDLSYARRKPTGS